MKGDFTRSTFDRRKRYASVRMQQGRVQIDADWNEQADVESHLHETAIGAILGPGAAPAAGGGFAVTVAPGGGDLLLGDGLLWVDGILCELGPGAEAAVAAFPGADEVEIAAGELEAGEIAPGDWIEIRHDGLGDGEDGDLARVTNVSADGRRFELDRDVPDPGEDASPRLRRRVSLASQRDLPAAPGDAEPPEAGGHLVYADVWRWHVTALEDPEIRESALGGPDTATRLRTVCQVKLLPLGESEVDDDGNVDPGAFDCGGELPGWDDLTAPPSGRLRARTRPETDPDEPCVVPSGGGYAGLENQLYRVEVHDGGVLGGDASEAPTFKWSRDNATVVTDWLGVDGAELRVRSVGRDHTLSFHGARWVELTDDGRELRGEPGVLVRLLKVIDDEHLEIDRDDLDLGDFPHHPKVRRWDLPDSAAGALAVERPGDNDGHLSIEQGIEVRFEDGSYRSGDHWWIPARAFVGERQGEIEWPRDAASSPLAQAPHGVEHHYLRLALVTHDGEAFDEGSESDCRDPFCTLPDACREHGEGGGCCTVSVGDGGDVATVQEAIERLPDAGGVVCIHPGTYRGAVRIEGRQGITLHGCGGRPRLTIGGDGPVVRVADSRDVTLRGFEIVAGTGVAVELEESAEGTLADVLLDDLDLEAGADSAVAGTGGRRVTLRGSRVVARRLDQPARDGVGTRPAVFLSGRDLTVEGNRVTAQLGLRPALLAAGGVQVGGGSVGVTVVGNEIRRGHGNGITLGSLREVDPPVVFDPSLVADLFRAAPFTRDRGVFRLDTTGLDAAPDATLPPVIVWNPTPDDGDDDATAISEGDLQAVQIAGNEIAGMGGNGIAVARFFDLSDDETAEMIVVEDLLVEGNRVHGCLLFRLGAFPEAVRPTAAFGGIALAGCERATFRGNVIEDNGRFRDEAVCGVYVTSAVGASFEGNRIVGNGRPVDPENEPLPGVRGGIVVGLAEAPTTPVTPFGDATTGLRQDGTPALRVHHNVVVSPEGRALEVVAVGAVSVLGNQLTAHGSHTAGREPVPGGGQGVGGLNNNVAARIDNAARVPLTARAAAPDPVRGFLDTLGGAVVAIVDLGVSNEVLFQLSGLSGTGLAGSRADLAGIGGDGEALFVGGNVMFNDNQVVLDAFLPAVTIAPSAVSIFSWDDVSMLGNQCDCDLLLDAVWFNTLVLGTSVRVTGNRFKEGQFALLSAFTRGWFNATRDNQGTHCFYVVGHPRLSQLGPNASLVDALLLNAAGGGICDSWEQASIAASAELGEQLP